MNPGCSAWLEKTEERDANLLRIVFLNETLLSIGKRKGPVWIVSQILSQTSTQNTSNTMFKSSSGGMNNQLRMLHHKVSGSDGPPALQTAIG